MTRLFLNAVASSAGAGLTYVRNVLPILSSSPEVHTTIAVGSDTFRQELGELNNVTYSHFPASSSAGRRFWREQTSLPGMLQEAKADVLVSSGNFALRNSRVPQILLSGNSLYSSRDFFRDVVQRRDYGLWLDTRIKAFFARQSVRWADHTVAPTEAFAQELRRWAGGNVVSIHHGFDEDFFFSGRQSLDLQHQQPLQAAQNSLRLLFVSHYNYYRNFETLLRAIPLLKARLEPRTIRLFLTCKFISGENPGSYSADWAAQVVEELGIAEEVVQLGAIPYRQLHHLYRACDIYVTPAYAETFAHPLVEAMASGVPVVASDIAVHREVCGDAALYFDRFSPQELSEQIASLAVSAEKIQQLRTRGRMRSKDFSWQKHVDKLLALANDLISKNSRS